MSPTSADLEPGATGATAIHPPAVLARPLRWRWVLAASAAPALVFGALLIWSANRPGGNAGAAPGAIAMSATDYGFAPDRLSWRAGQRVSITLTNDTQGRPGKVHEFMIGRRPIMNRTGFGLQPADGFRTDFFGGVTVRLSRARGLSMAMPGSARLVGPGAAGAAPGMPAPKAQGGQTMSPNMKMGSGPGSGGGAMPMSGGAAGGGNGLMLVLRPGGSVTLSFTVPDRPGRWEFACFQQNGEHYSNGMKGVIDVRPPGRG